MDDRRFSAEYKELEERMQDLAEEEGNIFVPNPEPDGPVDYVFVCMEPSLGGETPEELNSQVEAGGPNFLNSTEDFILHFCACRYLCDEGERYHITDISKGAMRVDQADSSREERYDRWHPLLLEELDLVMRADAQIFAVGKKVAEHLQRKKFSRPFTRILHYSPKAGRARNKGIEGHEDRFDAYRETISISDLLEVAEDILVESRVPSRLQQKTLSRLEQRELTPSRKKLMFNYKLQFDPM